MPASYVTDYTGLSNTALNFISTLPQYVTVNSPFLDLTNRSFTVEIWFYPTLLTSSDSGLFGQCQTAAMDQCLMYMIRNYHVYLAFHTGKNTVNCFFEFQLDRCNHLLLKQIYEN